MPCPVKVSLVDDLAYAPNSLVLAAFECESVAFYDFADFEVVAVVS